MATSQQQGLDEAEAQRRLAQVGPNELQRRERRGAWRIVVGTLREPMFLLLLAASGLYLLLGDLAEGVFLAAGASLAVSLVVIQEARSERALAALRRLAEPSVRVIRSGVQRRIPARQIVPGDIVLAGEGERLAADAVLVAGDVLTIDESTLTGEAATVAKHPASVPVEALAAAAPGGQDGSSLFAGTLIVGGHGLAEVVRTGHGTALGRIGAALAGIAEEPTPLQRTAMRLVGLLGVVAIGFCAVVVLAYGVLRGDWIEGVLAGVTVAIALIPEEFPMVLAVFLALGAWRLAQHKVLVRRSAVIEALGGATMLCVDKTGTLTENRMQVARLWVEGQSHDLRDGGALAQPARSLLRIAGLASAARSIDPMDQAILRLEGPHPAARTAAPVRTWPLRPERLAIIQLWEDAGGAIAAAKGAPETIFRMCGLDPARAAALQAVVEGLAAEGLRVLGVASCPGGFAGEPERAAFRFEGLVAFLDPLRAEVPSALREARGAGLSVAMITGDYPATAMAIAREAGVDTAAGVLTGAEVAALAPEALQARLREVRVFARVQPDQKLRLVEAFKAAGHVVAMTGDGVNDAPALEAAHIGVAMGERGTDVAREAADLVLLDDSFTAIVGGVRLGRRIFANLRKALIYVTAIHVPIAGLALLPVVLGLPPMLFPMHVVLLELVIDPVCSLVFEAEPSDRRAMTRPPRKPEEALFGLRQLALALLQGGVVLAAVLGLYAWGVERYAAVEARGAAFAALVGANLILAFSNSAAAGVSLFDRHRLIFWAIAVAALAVLGAALWVPTLAGIFQIAAPSPPLAAAAAAVALFSGGWFGAVKAGGARRRLAQP